MVDVSSLLGQVQADLLSGKPLPDLLRKCILIGSQTGSTELRTWATKELKGYEDEEELPAYRKVPCQIQADATTGNAIVHGQPIGLSMLPEFAQERITNQMPMFAGVGELEVLAEEGRKSGKSPQSPLPSWEVIAGAMDRASGNPFQHIHALYWVISPAAIAGILDDVRTALTELLAELGAVMPNSQHAPTAEQVTHALQVAVHGGSPQFTIAAPVTSLSASGGSSIEGFAGGQTGAAGNDLTQNASFDVTQTPAVKTWLAEYKSALPDIDAALRPIVEAQIDQVEAELDKAQPEGVVVRGLLGSLKAFAQNAIASAGAGAGTIGLAEVIAHWPLH